MNPRRSIARFGLAFLLSAIPGTRAFAGAFDASKVPADMKWVVHVDVDAAGTSKVCQAIKEELLRRPDVLQHLGELRGITGISVADDLHGVTIYGREFGEDNNVIVVDGKFDEQRILGALELGPAFSSEVYGNSEIVTWDDKGKTMYGAFFGHDQIVIARNGENVKSALDVLNKKTSAMQEPAGVPASPGTGAILYLAGEGLNDLAKQKGVSAIVRHAQSAWLVLGENSDKMVFAKAHVEALDDQQADRLCKAAEGIRAIVSMKASQDDADERTKMVDSMLAPLKITRSAKGADLDWQVSADTVADFVKKRIAAKGDATTQP